MSKRTSGRMAELTEPHAGKDAETSTNDSMEQRVVAFAEQLGWLAGTVQARSEGWMDRATLSKQLANVRDGAAGLLRQLGVSSTKDRMKKRPGAPAKTRNKGRSGGLVDAPGKKHRKPPPADPNAAIAARTQAAKRRSAPMTKANRQRGRG